MPDANCSQCPSLLHNVFHYALISYLYCLIIFRKDEYIVLIYVKSFLYYVASQQYMRFVNNYPGQNWLDLRRSRENIKSQYGWYTSSRPPIKQPKYLNWESKITSNLFSVSNIPTNMIETKVRSRYCYIFPNQLLGGR